VGRSLSYTQGFSYWPVSDMLRDWLCVSATTSEARVRLDLKAALHELFGPGEDPYPFLAGLLGLQVDPRAAAQVNELSRDARHRYPHRHVEVDLRPLDGVVTVELVRALADGALPDAVADVIADRAGGNPLFVGEALRDLVERGALRRGDGGYELAVELDQLE